MIYIILGGPATGKGTRSDILAKELNILHISTGDMLREAAKEDEKINELITSGKFVSDEVITELLVKKLKTVEAKNGAILDGYPRTISQAEKLNEVLASIGEKVELAIELVAPRELVFRRILERKTCPNCKRAYGIDFPSKNGETCDDCDTKLEIRSDDTKETLTKRIETYEEKTKPIIEYYRSKNLLKTVDSSNKPERILEMLEG